MLQRRAGNTRRQKKRIDINTGTSYKGGQVGKVDGTAIEIWFMCSAI